MIIPHCGDCPATLFCGIGHRDGVPSVEALAFWGRAVEQLIERLAQLPVEIAICEEQLERARSERVGPQPHHGGERPASTRE